MHDFGTDEFQTVFETVKRLTAIVLVLWTACFLHCSAEQFGLVACGTCPTEKCGSEERPCPEDEQPASPCGVCDFLEIGGVPTITPLAVDAADWVALQDFTDFLASAERLLCQTCAVASISFSAGRQDGYLCPSLYTRLVSTSLPTRAPNTSFVS